MSQIQSPRQAQRPHPHQISAKQRDRLKLVRPCLWAMGKTTNLPLAVDLDGTLILTDMSRVTIRRVVLPRFWLFPWLLYLELTGQRARWKRVLGRRLKFDPAELVYHEAFLAWLKEQKPRAGR